MPQVDQVSVVHRAILCRILAHRRYNNAVRQFERSDPDGFKNRGATRHYNGPRWWALFQPGLSVRLLRTGPVPFS
jgi:hypothetical protein